MALQASAKFNFSGTVSGPFRAAEGRLCVHLKRPPQCRGHRGHRHDLPTSIDLPVTDSRA